MRQVQNIKKKLLVIAGLLTILMLFMAFNRHSKTGMYFYRSQIFADKAGYYVYLPATFIYSFEIKAFPDSVDIKTGNGFSLDKKRGKLITKYSYGVALLQTPFFLAAHFLSKPLGYESNGFSMIYHYSIDVASVFYLVSALLFLFLILIKKFKLSTSIITLFFLLFGTNLLYYSIIETGMTHVYSLCMLSIYFYFSSFLYGKKFEKTGILSGLLGLLAGISLIIRPTSIIVLIAIHLIHYIGIKPLKIRIKARNVIMYSFGIILVIIPQIIYWKYISGTLFYNPYQGETFSNFLNPKILSYLFAPENGMFLYDPMLLLIVTGIIMMIWNKQKVGLIIGIVFLFSIYLFSSWWIYSFGCGFGARNTVDFFVLLVIPLAHLYERSINRRDWITYFVFTLSVIFSFYSFKMTYSYGGCWFGDGNWDWSEYLHWLTRAMH